ncbi:hypothetical protein [Haloarcula nitratireducens]|uniref:DUF8147 domain-containing protein n=1 Tax=Haloarcula nitratireducens TaxID=2487749 RepID=A0AAW4PFN5_9EURY|nr:hypothetical protein [Halomicroarcula nitratireducens]MBX0296719.1 hypothetical protein [Halomicroarcula nitratireducens]
MNTLRKSVVSLFAGVLAFAIVGVGVTEALAPHIWPSAMLGLPAGLVAGLVALPLTYLGLTYRTERRATGRASARTRRRLRTVAGATVGFVVGGGLAMAVVWTQAIGLATAIVFVGFPVAFLSAIVAGYIAFRRSPVDRQPPSSPMQ